MKLIIFCSILLILILLSLVANYVPHDYVVSVGDMPFRYNIRDNFRNTYFFQWSNLVGEGRSNILEASQFFQHSLFYILDSFNVSNNDKQNVRFVVFLFISGLSMYCALGLLFGNPEWVFRTLVSLLYVFNQATLLFFVSGGGYYTYYDIYMAFPLLFSLIVLGLTHEDGIRYILIGCLLTFFFIGAFSNPAFFLGFVLIVNLYLLLTKGFTFFLTHFRRSLCFHMILFFLLAFYLVPISYAILTKTITIEGVGISDQTLRWAKAVLVPLTYVFRLNIFRFATYPIGANYNAFVYVVSNILAYLPFALAAFGLVLAKDSSKRQIYSAGIIVICIIFYSTLMRYVELFLEIFFLFPLASALRSPEKLTIYLPFLVLFMIFLGYHSLKEKKYFKKIIYPLLIVCLVYPLPFWIGRIHRNISFNEVWDYEYDAMVKVPHSYKKIAEVINADAGYYKILSLPFTGEIGKGWVLRKKMKFIGFDSTVLFFRNPVYLPLDIPGCFRMAKEISEEPDLYDSKNFLRQLQIRGIKYLILDKFVGDKRYLNNFLIFFKKSSHLFDKVVEIENLEVYALKNEYFLPHIYLSATPTRAARDIEALVPMTNTRYLSRKLALLSTEQSDRPPRKDASLRGDR